MLQTDRELVRKLQSLVYDKSGLYFPKSKDLFFERQLKSRIETEGFEDLSGFYDHVLNNPGKLDSLVQDLTTNETYFFRNAAHFAALEKTVFPGIIDGANRAVIKSWCSPAERKPGKPHPAMKIRIWSAGCSTGEEAYSAAFSLLETLSYPRAWDIEIIATDIKREALDAARQGVYEAHRLRDIGPSLLNKYMEPRGRAWKVKEYPASLVKFYEGNLNELSLEGTPAMTLRAADGAVRRLDAAGYFDVIFCRNVMIYFDRAGQQRLVGALYGCVRPGGYLFTGDSEPLHLFEHGFERARAEDSLYYFKPAGDKNAQNP